MRRDGDGHWCFRHARHMAVGNSDLVTTTLGQMMDRQPTIRGLADLPHGHQAWGPEADGCWSRCAAPTGPTFFVQFEVTPGPGNDAADDTAGAVVNCWIRADSVESAIEIARADIDSEGWIIDAPEEAYLIERQDCEEDDDGLEYFDQAQVNSVVFVFHCYP